MWQDTKFAFKDFSGDWGYTGFNLDVATVKDFTVTYVPAVNAICDAKIMRVDTKTEATITPAPTPVDGEHVERVGTIRIYHRAAGTNGRRRLSLQALGLADAYVDKPALGTDAREAIVSTSVATIVAAFITDSGEAAADWDVIGNYVSQRPL